MKQKILIFVFFSFLIISCNNAEKNEKNKNKDNTKQTLLAELPEFPIDTFIDARDNKKYAIIKIGNQTWIKGLIKYKTIKGRMYRDNLYNWNAAANACPQSFKIPSEKDWYELFHYVYTTVIKKSSPDLIKKVSNSGCKLYCNECKNTYRNDFPCEFDINKTIANFDSTTFSKQKEFKLNEMVLMHLFLENIGFCTYGSGFKYQGGTGTDDYSYFWTSSTDYAGDHKYMKIYNGMFANGDYSFLIKFNDNYGCNLKCLKIN